MTKPRVTRGSYLWTVVGEIRTVVGAWLCKYIGSAQVNTCFDAVWSFLLPLMCELFTAAWRETTDALASPRATSILPVPTVGITRTADGTRGKTDRRNAA
ncbi:hypothetical protein AVEN_274212-1 [Araneus ventricosus]|uniref:Uncharacterized protein n=1 Tax=Araneus ventricosus TaxID=182803 RepID=A0A4Y2W216_ARAVE|nr:hypothetical protein AVEN_239998-1 [Araneus ventricosus]GBO31409.1 hypothetical protein AVEN_274212-1 [Araneus ventricosus]